MCKGKMGCCHPMMKAAGMLALRLALGFIFIYMGYGKLGPNHEGVAKMMLSIGLPGNGNFWAYFVGALELLGGAMLVLGVYARYAAAWLSVIMLVAMFTVHRGGPVAGYFLPLSALGGLLATLGAGAGKWRLVKTECHCKDCKMAMSVSESEGGCCGGGCGGCGDDKMEAGKCGCQKCCNGRCGCGAPNGQCAHCMGKKM